MKADGFAHPYLTVKFLTQPGLTPYYAVRKERFVANNDNSLLLISLCLGSCSIAGLFYSNSQSK